MFISFKFNFCLFFLNFVFVSSFGQNSNFKSPMFITSVGNLDRSLSFSYPISLNQKPLCIDVKTGLSLINAPRGINDFSINCNQGVIFNNLKLQIRPNPVSTRALIKIENTTLVRNDFVDILIYNGDGSILFDKFKISTTDLLKGVSYDFSSLPEGVYILQINSVFNKDALKFIKIS